MPRPHFEKQRASISKAKVGKPTILSWAQLFLFGQTTLMEREVFEQFPFSEFDIE